MYRRDRSHPYLHAGRSSVPLKHVASYTITQLTSRHTCIVQLEPRQYTSSAQEAFSLCDSRPLCTYVAYKEDDGSTILCQGLYDKLEVASSTHMWINAVKKVRCSSMLLFSLALTHVYAPTIPGLRTLHPCQRLR
jgi:hypothetical protein